MYIKQQLTLLFQQYFSQRLCCSYIVYLYRESRYRRGLILISRKAISLNGRNYRFFFWIKYHFLNRFCIKYRLFVKLFDSHTETNCQILSKNSSALNCLYSVTLLVSCINSAIVPCVLLPYCKVFFNQLVFAYSIMCFVFGIHVYFKL